MNKSIKILYIDDNPFDRELVLDSLEKEHGGFELIKASSKSEFERLIKESNFDLILSDFNIAGFDGLQVLEIVQSEHPDTPVIIVTGTGSEEIAVQALKRGAADYVIKTAKHIQRLPQTIFSVLENKKNELKRIELEKQLIQSQKLESLGTLVSGISHDFNNILSIILGHATILENLNPEPGKNAESINAITKAVQRGAGLVKQLLTFARKNETNIELMQINDMVKELIELSFQTFPKTVIFQTKLEENLPLINADQTQIHQIILNLFVNSRYAIANNGVINILTSIVDGTLLLTNHPAEISKKYVLLRVSDNGIGISEEIKHKIFEPFFTTKELGTGLGLSMVYSIVKNHNGFIDVSSKVGIGTEFSIYFPIPEEIISLEDPVKNTLTPDSGTGVKGTILLIDDEELIIEFLNELLISEGYKVLTANNGEEGLVMFIKHQKEISLIISDLKLPKLPGEEVFKQIIKIKPDINVIIASGFISQKNRSELSELGIKSFIQKPYEISDILKVIKESI